MCDEIEGAHTWDVMGRGTSARVITDLNRPWGFSDTCTSCGKCIHVCPTGALFAKGKSATEMVKNRDFLTYIKMGREKKTMDQINTPPVLAEEGKVRVATVWLGGCSGCHMSFVDLDERLIDLADKINLVYGPLMDAKEFPENVTATLVEGAVANNEHLHLIRQVRSRTKILVSFGDCAVSGNITALRNPLGKVEPVLQRAYIENAAHQPQIPSDFSIIPKMLDRVRPVHEVVNVGCIPAGSVRHIADQIYFVLTELLAGRIPDLTGKLKFGSESLEHE